MLNSLKSPCIRPALANLTITSIKAEYSFPGCGTSVICRLSQLFSALYKTSGVLLTMDKHRSTPLGCSVLPGLLVGELGNHDRTKPSYF